MLVRWTRRLAGPSPLFYAQMGCAVPHEERRELSGPTEHHAGPTAEGGGWDYWAPRHTTQVPSQGKPGIYGPNKNDDVMRVLLYWVSLWCWTGRASFCRILFQTQSQLDGRVLGMYNPIKTMLGDFGGSLNLFERQTTLNPKP